MSNKKTDPTYEAIRVPTWFKLAALFFLAYLIFSNRDNYMPNKKAVEPAFAIENIAPCEYQIPENFLGLRKFIISQSEFSPKCDDIVSFDAYLFDISGKLVFNKSYDEIKIGDPIITNGLNMALLAMKGSNEAMFLVSPEIVGDIFPSDGTIKFLHIKINLTK